RLDVAMDDQILMRVMHGGTDIAKEAQPLLDAEALPVAVRGDGHSLHVFHDQEREVCIRDAAVEQLRDVRMVQRGKDLSLGDEAAMKFLVVSTASQHFDRDSASILTVGRVGQVED